MEEGGAQKRTKQRIRDTPTPTPLSLPPTSHKPSGDWINVSLSILVSEGRLSVMPFPNEDNHFQEFESGANHRRKARQASRQGRCYSDTARRLCNPVRQKKTEPGQKKRIKNLPRSDCRSFSVERESLSPPPEVQHVYGREAPLLANRLSGSCQSLAVALPCMGSYHDLVLFSQKSSNPETLHGPRP